MTQKLLALLLTLLSGCSSSDAPTPQTRPQLPSPTVDTFSDVMNHPWVVAQGITTPSNGVINDIRSLHSAWKQLGRDSFEEDSAYITEQLIKLQQRLPFTLNIPAGWYNIINLPQTQPYNIYQRLYLGDSTIGFPLYLDVRVFDDTPDKVVEWHKKTLEEEDAFTQSIHNKWTVLQGHGHRNMTHHDTSHGMATGERTVFVAIMNDGQKTYALHIDGPKESVQPLLNSLYSLLD